MLKRNTRPSRLPSPGRIVCGAALALLLALPALLPALAGAPALAAEPSSCVACHRDPGFLVRNKKLYDYFQGWRNSIHNQEGVGCEECHGGDPDARDKEAAHGTGAMGAAEASSPISYQNIPKTCARCHDEVYAAFRKSEHFEHLVTEGKEQQGPNCVTCHGSVNTAVLNVNTVRETCAQCHNPETDNRPQVPDKAEEVLNHFLSIHRYYRFITKRADAEDAKAFFSLVDPMIERVSAEWHTFDIERVDRLTEELVRTMKAKRKDILREGKPERRRSARESGTRSRS